MRINSTLSIGKYLFLFVSLLFSCQASATEALLRPADILYVLSKDSSFYQNFVDQLQQHINTSNNSLQHKPSLRISSNDKNIREELNSGYKLVVSVGSEALRVISENNYEGHVFSVLVPEVSFKKYNHSIKYSALYADHPVSLYLKLIKISIPKGNRVGILLGPSSSIYESELEDAAKKLGLHLQLKKINKSEHVSRRIGQLAANIDVILAIPDPVIHNKRTAQSILYAGYRNNIPVIAYSSSYLKAGAMISLFSSPEQLAEDAATHIIEKLKNTGLLEQAPAHPSIFSIGVNKNVSRSLAREELDEARLKNLLTSDAPIKHE